jgi:sugar phosphate isomerase/epimerase
MLARRTFIAAGASAFLAGAVPAVAAQLPFFARTGLPIGLELYTLGPDLGAHLDEQFAALHAIGFRVVEPSTLFGRTPRQFRTSLDKAGLSASSMHLSATASGSDPAIGDEIGPLAEAMHVLGVETVILPFLLIPGRLDAKPRPGESYGAAIARTVAQMSDDDWKLTADFLNRRSRVLQQAGLSLGYHNHNVEFFPRKGRTGLDILLENTDPELVCFEMDAGWVAAAGADPAKLLEQYPGRFRLMHVKDLKPGTKPNFAMQMEPANLGAGIIDWAKLLPLAYRSGVRQFIIEQEPPFLRPRIDSVRLDFEYLQVLKA